MKRRLIIRPVADLREKRKSHTFFTLYFATTAGFIFATDGIQGGMLLFAFLSVVFLIRRESLSEQIHRRAVDPFDGWLMPWVVVDRRAEWNELAEQIRKSGQQ